jgi:hypothetical protein
VIVGLLAYIGVLVCQSVSENLQKLCYSYTIVKLDNTFQPIT